MQQALGEDQDEDLHANVARMTSADDDFRTCMNSLFLEKRESVTIIDSGADTCVLGKAWQVLAENPTRR